MRISFVSSTCYIDFDGWTVVVSRKEEEGNEKKEVEITQPQMYKVLEYFAEHPGRYISKKELFKECWGVDLAEWDKGYDNTIQPQISNCRKLDPELYDAIETMPGGYRYNGNKITDSSTAVELNMTDVRGFCIEDTDHSGCQVRREESGPKSTTAVIDFSLTDSRLCSVVYFTGQRDWSTLAGNHKLCFNARALPCPTHAEVEVRLKGCDFPMPILIREESGAFEIPLRHFASPEAWEEVQEIHFLFHRRTVRARTAVTIENLRLEG